MLEHDLRVREARQALDIVLREERESRRANPERPWVCGQYPTGLVNDIQQLAKPHGLEVRILRPRSITGEDLDLVSSGHTLIELRRLDKKPIGDLSGFWRALGSVEREKITPRLNSTST